MKTLEEIKALVYPTEKVDWPEVLKNLLAQKTKNGELVTFNSIYLYSVGDPDLYVRGVSLANGNIIIAAEMVYGGAIDAYFIGTLSDTFSSKNGIRLTDESIKKICKEIIEKKHKVEFDFSSMKYRGRNYFSGDSFEEKIEKNDKFKKTIEGYVNGTSTGYVEW